MLELLAFLTRYFVLGLMIEHDSSKKLSQCPLTVHENPISFAGIHEVRIAVCPRPAIDDGILVELRFCIKSDQMAP